MIPGDMQIGFAFILICSKYEETERKEIIIPS
jgi:hypothetical protein